MQFVREWGMIAGLAGLALGVFLILFREVIRKNIFSKLTKNQSFQIIKIFMILTFTLSVLSIGAYVFVDQSPLDNGTGQLTVYLRTKESKVQAFPGIKGDLIIDFRNDRRTVPLQENGTIVVNEIPSEFFNSEIGIGLHAEGYEMVYPDSQYTYNNKPIYLTIEKENKLGIIKGVVKNIENSEGVPSASVRVINKLKGVEIKTDSLGFFTIYIPKDKQIKSTSETYRIRIEKTGYQTHEFDYHFTEDYHPIHLFTL